MIGKGKKRNPNSKEEKDRKRTKIIKLFYRQE